VRGTRHKFELQPQVNHARSWQFLLTGVGQPSVIANLTAGADQLLFQWTEEAAKQAAVARQLCNCTVALTAGSSKHFLGLRPAIVASPIVVDVEKPATSKWTLGELPVGKHIFVEVTRVEGLKDTLVEPKQPVVVGEPITVWLGEEPKSLPLAVKLSTSSNARDFEIKQQAHIRFEEQEPRLYRRKELLGQHFTFMQQLELIGPELTKTKNSRPTRDVEKLLKEQKIDALAKQQLAIGKTLETINFATGFAEKYGGAVLVHVRVYYQAGDHQLDLLRTEEAPPAKK
jgi:hypothetical protein